MQWLRNIQRYVLVANYIRNNAKIASYFHSTALARSVWELQLCGVQQQCSPENAALSIVQHSPTYDITVAKLKDSHVHRTGLIILKMFDEKFGQSSEKSNDSDKPDPCECFTQFIVGIYTYWTNKVKFKSVNNFGM